MTSTGLGDLRDIFGAGSGDKLAEDFFCSKITYSPGVKTFEHPCRFDGYAAFFCIKGSFKLEINLRTYSIRPGTVVVYTPGGIVRSSNLEGEEGFECVVVAVSRRILADAKFDLSRLFEESLSILSNPCIELEAGELSLCRQYFTLATSLLPTDGPYLKDSLTALGGSIFFYLGGIWKDRLVAAQKQSGGSMRSNLLVENFIKLVFDNHADRRDVGFYADKLCLTPKYLSQLVRKVSGKSAPEWIDSFVILDAGHLLKYSDLEIKEIAARLNFADPAVFSRYFKAHTGRTPAEYRKN